MCSSVSQTAQNDRKLREELTGQRDRYIPLESQHVCKQMAWL